MSNRQKWHTPTRIKNKGYWKRKQPSGSIKCVDIDIFVNCNRVDTRWQQYSTHLHTNSTRNTTLVYVCDIFCEVNISLTSTTWMNHLRLNVSYSFSSTTSRTSNKFGEYSTLPGPEIVLHLLSDNKRYHNFASFFLWVWTWSLTLMVNYLDLSG